MTAAQARLLEHSNRKCGHMGMRWCLWALLAACFADSIFHGLEVDNASISRASHCAAWPLCPGAVVNMALNAPEQYPAQPGVT